MVERDDSLYYRVIISSVPPQIYSTVKKEVSSGDTLGGTSRRECTT